MRMFRSIKLGALAGALSVLTVSGLGALSTAGVGAVTPTAPAAPTDAVATPGYQSVELSWTVGANNGDPITSFVVGGYLSGTLITAASLPVGAVGSDLDPTPGAHDFFVLAGTQTVTAYSFTVSSMNAAGVSAPSAISNVVTSTAAPVAPFAPYNLSAAAATTGGATVKWSVPTTNGSGITSYIITPYVGAAAQTATVVAATAGGTALSPIPGATDTDTITGLTAGTSYTFTVAATNGVGTSPASVASNAITAAVAAAPQLSASVSQLNFGDVTLGNFSDDQSVTLTNTGTVPLTISEIDIAGPASNDFLQDDGTTCSSTPMAPGASCVLEQEFAPGALGARTAVITPNDGTANVPSITLTGTGSEGYYEVTASGHVDVFGDAVFQGDLTGQSLPAPIVNIVSTADNGGYWLFDSLGNVYDFGDAGYFGDLGSLTLNRPIVGMAATDDDGGYLLVASDGGIFTFGDAQFFGSMGGVVLNKPIVGMAETPDSAGYWMVASDGGIFSFGDAPFYGSTGNIKLNKPIVGMSPTADYGGYWMVASDGGMFSFGDAQFHGSTGNLKLVRPIVGMAVTATGNGYWLDASDGGIFSFGDAPFYGSDGGRGITNSAGIALDGFSTFQAFTDSPAARFEGHATHQANAPKPQPEAHTHH